MKVMIVSQGVKENPAIKGTAHKINKYLKEKGHDTLFYMKGKSNALLYLLNIPKFYYNYLKFKPDIILCYHQIAIVPIILKLFFLIRKANIVYAQWDAYTEVMGKKWPAALLAFIEYFNIKNADHVITNSLLSKSICYNIGVYAEWFPLGVESYFNPNVHPSISPGKNKIKVLYVGDQTRYKRVDLLINAVKDLKCDLILVGLPNEEFKRESSNNIYFSGMIEHNKIPGYIKAADIVVLLSDQDGTLKMYEYIRMHKCVLAFKGRVGYYLTHMENAYLTTDFKEGLKILIKNSDLRKKLEKGISKLRSYTLDEALEMQLKYFENVCN